MSQHCWLKNSVKVVSNRNHLDFATFNLLYAQAMFTVLVLVFIDRYTDKLLPGTQS